MGFAGVRDSNDLPTILGEFESTKHTDVHRTMIIRKMEPWA